MVGSSGVCGSLCQGLWAWRGATEAGLVAAAAFRVEVALALPWGLCPIIRHLVVGVQAQGKQSSP